MSMFKRCGTAMALVLASTLPALSQDAETVTLAVPEGFVAPEGSVVLQFAGTEAIYVVPYDVAAELCRVTEGEFATVAESGVDVIFCEQIDETTFATFNETEGVETLVDRRADNDDDSAAVEGDDAGDVDAGTEDDAATEDAAIEDDDAAEGEDPTGDDASTDVDAGADVDAELDAEAGADDGAAVNVESGADAGAEAGTDN